MTTKTRLTKTGQPVLGSPIEVKLADDSWERATVISKGWGRGRDAHMLIMLGVEWADGSRQPLPFQDITWRPVA